MTKTKKTVIWIATACIGLGILIAGGAFAIAGFDFMKLNTGKTETRTYEITEAFHDLDISAVECAVRFERSAGSECRVVCVEGEEFFHTAEVTDATLHIYREGQRKWYQYISNLSPEISSQITVYLPERAYEKLRLESASGSIEVPADFSFETADVRSASGRIQFAADVSGEFRTATASGRIELCAMSPESCRAESVSGRIDVTDITAKTLTLNNGSGSISLKNADVAAELDVNTVSGKVELRDVKCRELTGGSGSGRVELHSVVAGSSFSIETVAGGIELTHCDALVSICLKTVSGNVNGQLLTGKLFDASSVSGNISVPSSVQGGVCKVSTTSGRISMEVEEN